MIFRRENTPAEQIEKVAGGSGGGGDGGVRGVRAIGKGGDGAIGGVNAKAVPNDGDPGHIAENLIITSARAKDFRVVSLQACSAAKALGQSCATRNVTQHGSRGRYFPRLLRACSIPPVLVDDVQQRLAVRVAAQVFDEDLDAAAFLFARSRRRCAA